jgi:Mn-containing catalase
MFMKALDAMGKLDDPFFGTIEPDDTVRLVFNLSQGEDERGPWNDEPDFEYVSDPAPNGGFAPPPNNPDDEDHGDSPPRRARAKSRGK